MAVSITDDGSSFRNVVGETSTGYPASTANLTLMLWVRFDVADNASVSRNVYSLHDNWAEGQPAWTIGRWPATGSLNVYVEPFNGDSAWDPDDYVDLAFGTLGSSLTLGQWYHLAYVKSGTSHKVYRDGVEVSSGALVQPANSTEWSQGFEVVGPDPGNQTDWAAAHFRVWTVALTQAEVQAEMASFWAVRTADLFRDLPLRIIDGTDVSGHGHHFNVTNPSGMDVVTGQLSEPETWVDIANFVDVSLDSQFFPGGEARVYCDAWNSAPSVTAQLRLYNVTDGVSVGESEPYTDVTPTDQSFNVTLTTGVKTYRMQVTSDTLGVGLFCQSTGLGSRLTDEEEPVDTLWLNETFSQGAITFETTPEYWTEEDGYYWEYQYEPTCAPNYTRLVGANYIDVADGKLVFSDPSSVMANFTAYGGFGTGYGNACPQAPRHFISGDFAFVEGGSFSDHFYANVNGAWQVGVDLDDYLGETVTIILRVQDGLSGEGEGGYLRYAATATKTKTQLLAMSPVTVRLEWQYASSAVATDGWAKVYFNDEVIYNETGIALWLDYQQTADGMPVNTFTTVSVGSWGAFGASVDNLKAGIPGA